MKISRSNIQVVPVAEAHPAQHPDANQPQRAFLRRLLSLFRRLLSLFRRVRTAWTDLQVSHQGKYSIERLMAMHNYYHTTSITRVLLVCLAIPVPALLAAILVELIPLQPPAAGSIVNWGLWIRIWTTLFIMNMAMTTQVKVIIPELPFTTLRCLAISIISASVYVAVGVFVGELIAFPIPFMLVLGGLPGTIVSCLTVLLVLRLRPSTMDPQQRLQLQRFFRICMSAGVMLTTYPSYNAVFVSAEPRYQNGLILILQVIKLIAKNVTAKALRHLEDYLPEYVVFLVEVFNALYLTSCMQNANSLYTVALIISLDLGQAAWELYSIETRATTMQALMKECWKRDPDMEQADFLALAVEICRQPQRFTQREARQIQLRACLEHQLSLKHKEILRSLESLKIFGPGGRVARASVSGASGGRRSPSANTTSVSPVGVSSSLLGPSLSPGRESEQKISSLADTAAVLTNIQAFRSVGSKDNRSSQLVHQTLHSLFTVEYLVLVEYVECIIPFVYVVYTAVRSHLPSAVYYPPLSSNGTEFQWSLLGNVMLYTGLEFCTFVVLNAMYWWKFRFLPLYQLAFVLENQFELVQSKLVLWVIILLQFQLVHYGKGDSEDLLSASSVLADLVTASSHVLGADFTFGFAWLKHHELDQ